MLPAAMSLSERARTDWRPLVRDRIRVARTLLVVYAIGSVAIAIPLLLGLGNAGDLAATTSGKILAAALVAMAFGALAASRDPWRDRLMIRVIIAFTALSAIAIAYRLAFEDHAIFPTLILLPLAIAAPILFALYYPRSSGD
jgi:peptidoglycan/LPS O-acetylase OafA/YrhL